MRKYWSLFVAVLAVAGCAREEMMETAPVSKADKPLEIKYVPGSVIIKLDDSMVAMAEENPDALAKELGGDYMERIFPYAGEYEERTRAEGLHRYYKLHVKENAPVTKAAGDLNSVPGIVMATPELPVRPRLFNDPEFYRQWHLANSRYAGADINVQKVWEEFSTGSSNVIVSVVDEGVYMDHEDLQGALIPCYANGTGSYNFNNDSPNVVPTQGHGTHVAGIIAAVNNNGKGICSVAGGDYEKGVSGVKVLSCQIFDQWGLEPNIFAALKHGADHGAVILQCSWGFSPDLDGDGYTSDEEIEAYRSVIITDPVLEPYKAGIDYFIKYAGCDKKGNQKEDSPMKGGLVIFAAGNDNFDYDPLVSYEPIIAVGSFGMTGKRSSFSNWGDWIDISAPGGEAKVAGIYSTLAGVSAYGGNDWVGTSFAAPHVSGVAALLVSYFGGPGFTAEECKARLLRGAQDHAFPGDKFIGRKLDAYGAFTYDMNATPQPPVITKVGEDIPAKLGYKDNASLSFSVSDPANQLYTVALEPESDAASIDYDQDGNFRVNFNLTLLDGDQEFTVVATNESGLRSTLGIKFTVVGDAVPQMAPQEIIQAPLDKGPVEIDLGAIFSDPDEDPITFEASSSDEEVLTVALDKSKLTLTPKAEGKARVKIVASDGYRQAEYTLKVFVGALDNGIGLRETKVTQYVTIDVNTASGTEVEISVYSASGAWVYGTVVVADAFSPAMLDLRSIAPGRYVLVAKYGGEVQKQSFVKY